MFAIITTRWQTRPLSRRAKRRSSAAPGSLRKKYADIVDPPNMVPLPINSTTSGDHRKPVLGGYRGVAAAYVGWATNVPARMVLTGSGGRRQNYRAPSARKAF